MAGRGDVVGGVEIPGAAEDRTPELADGRRLGMRGMAAPDGEPLFYFHGHPGSRLEARFAHAAAAEADDRVIALDRPSYGLSDFKPRRVLRDWPDDVADAQLVRRPEVAEYRSGRHPRGIPAGQPRGGLGHRGTRPSRGFS